MGWYPGCGGCCLGEQLPSCVNFADDFDDGVINPRWVQDAGTWTEANGYLSTNSQNARIYSSQNTGARGVGAHVYATEVEDEAILWLNRVSDFAFVGVRVAVGESGVQYGKLSLIYHDGFGEREYFCWTDQADRNNWFRLDGCYQVQVDAEPPVLSARILDQNGDPLVQLQRGMPSLSLFQPSCGLGTGSLSGQARFDNYQERITYQTGYLHCGRCDTGGAFCYHDETVSPGYGGQALFINGSGAKQWSCNISGIVAGTCPNTDCVDKVNAIYVVPVLNSALLGPCNGRLESDILGWCSGGIEQIERITVDVDTTPVGAYGCKIIVELKELTTSTSTTLARWEKIYADGAKLEDVVNVDMPLVSSGSFLCNGTNAQCLLTAIP